MRLRTFNFLRTLYWGIAIVLTVCCIIGAGMGIGAFLWLVIQIFG